MNNERIKLFSDSDLDGVSCGVIATLVFGENVDIEYCRPNDIDSAVTNFIKGNEYTTYKKVFITDLVIKESTAALIDSLNNFQFKLFDHHRSNYINNKYRWAQVYESFNNVKTCGAELFWNHLKEYYVTADINYTVIDKYIEYVRLWDTWDWVEASNEGIYARNLNTIFNIYSKTKYLNLMVNRLADNSSEYITEMEFEIIKAEELRKTRYIKQKMKNVRIISVQGYNIAYVFAENYIAELGNYMVKNVENIKYAAIINVDTCVVSLRASKDANVDLSKIAKTFSSRGGGHPLSAGFVFESRLSKYLVENIFNLHMVMKNPDSD